MGNGQLSLNNQDLIAPCGLYCGECSGFQDQSCGGCISHKGLCLKYTKICQVYDCCVEERNLRFCYQCSKFPCAELQKFFDTSEWYQTVVDNLKKIQKVGLQKFLDIEVKRVRGLIACAKSHKISHCFQCPEKPCLQLEREPQSPA